MTTDISSLYTGSPVAILQLANTATNGLFGIFILLILGVVLFFTARIFNPNKESFGAATFVIMILSVLFRIINIVDTKVVGACVFLFAGAVILLINDR